MSKISEKVAAMTPKELKAHGDKIRRSVGSGPIPITNIPKLGRTTSDGYMPRKQPGDNMLAPRPKSRQSPKTNAEILKEGSKKIQKLKDQGRI